MGDIPRQFRLTVSRGQAVPVLGVPAGSSVSLPGRPQGRGPLWFRKMDRNGDGDVSRREFLGSQADFERIDTDGDGLIDVQEAERADAWFRQKLQKRP
jgi:hypothetical protein